MGQDTGIYQDNQNYPFPQFQWSCGAGVRYIRNWNLADSRMRDAIPVELDNTFFWQWTWLILLTYIISGVFWLMGFLWFFPFSILMNLYNLGVVVYGTQLMLFEQPQRLNF